MKLKDVYVPPLTETIERGRRLISPKTGIIKRIWRQLADPDDIALFYYFAEGADIGRYWASPKSLKALRYGYAAAGSVTAERAMVAAIGELVERYCSAFYEEQEFIFASFRELRFSATPPEHFALFAQEQYQQPHFKYSPFTEQTKVNWVQGISLIREEPVLVPACFVYVPYFPSPGEALIYQSTSNGLAAGNSLEEAILKGLCEVIERDAFMITWYRMISSPQIDLRETRGLIQEVLERFTPAHVQIYVGDITTELKIPTMVALIIQESGRGGAAAVGAAASLNPTVAVLKALEEAALTRLWVKSMLKETPTNPFKDDFNRITEFSHHPLTYGYLEMLPHMQFLRQTPGFVPLETIPDRSTGSILGDISTCLQILGDAGYDVIVVDVTTPDVAAVGFRVARVVIPGLQPLDVQYNYRYLGEKRLKEQPEHLNAYPHPFP